MLITYDVTLAVKSSKITAAFNGKLVDTTATIDDDGEKTGVSYRFVTEALTAARAVGMVVGKFGAWDVAQSPRCGEFVSEPACVPGHACRVIRGLPFTQQRVMTTVLWRCYGVRFNAHQVPIFAYSCLPSDFSPDLFPFVDRKLHEVRNKNDPAVSMISPAGSHVEEPSSQLLVWDTISSCMALHDDTPCLVFPSVMKYLATDVFTWLEVFVRIVDMEILIST